MNGFIEWLIKRLVNLLYKRTHFMSWSWGIDDKTDVYIVSAEYHDDYWRFGTHDREYQTDCPWK